MSHPPHTHLDSTEVPNNLPGYVPPVRHLRPPSHSGSVLRHAAALPVIRLSGLVVGVAPAPPPLGQGRAGPGPSALPGGG